MIHRASDRMIHHARHRASSPHTPPCVVTARITVRRQQGPSLAARGVLPVDFVTSSKFGEDGTIETATLESGVKAGMMGLDCGPKTIELNAAAIK
eukprot:6416468-Prymnesium_polylepis.2